MIIHMVEGATAEQADRVMERIGDDYGLQCETLVGTGSIVIGVKGVAAIVDEGRVSELPGVDRVIRITEKYKDASRSFHRHDTVVDVGGVPVGGGNLAIFGGPCAIESEEQAVESARSGKLNRAAHQAADNAKHTAEKPAPPLLTSNTPCKPNRPNSAAQHIPADALLRKTTKGEPQRLLPAFPLRSRRS